MGASGKTPSGIFFGIPSTARAVVASLDEPWTERVAALLDEIGCKCSRARSIESVLRSVETAGADLLIVDASLEGALDLCRKLKARISTNGIPFILRGDGDGDEQARRRAIDAGCDHWVGSSVPSLEELRSRVLHLLQWRGLLSSLFESHTHLRARRDWVRYLVHDLRTPLAWVMAGLSFLGDKLGDDFDAEATVSLRDMSFQLHRMNAMLQDMLDIDRIQHREMQLARVRLNLSRLVHQAAADVRSLARRRRIEVVVEGPSDCEVIADPSLTERVIGNLLGNALRHARREIRLALALEPRSVQLRVLNDGDPIPKDMRERIFIPFVHAKGGHAGVGLGLAFCRLVATAHGGRMELRSSAEGQVCFQLTLPSPCSS